LVRGERRGILQKFSPKTQKNVAGQRRRAAFTSARSHRRVKPNATNDFQITSFPDAPTTRIQKNGVENHDEYVLSKPPKTAENRRKTAKTGETGVRSGLETRG